MSPSCKSTIVSLSEVPFEGSSQISNSHYSNQRTVLVVDDEPMVADTLSAVLSLAGFTTHTAYDGVTALKRAGKLRPQLLISDVAMPGMNGVELALAMVKAVPECKVLLFSGHATSADLVRATDAGHDFPLLTKPIHPKEMIRHVEGRLTAPAHGVKAKVMAEPVFLHEMLETA
jgi:CheY-like chemotaxis protein